MSELTLHEWQSRFRKELRAGTPLTDEALFSAATGLARRFSVYTFGYETRTFDTIRDHLPLTARLFGEARMRALVREFLAGKTGYEMDLDELVPKFAAFFRSSPRTPAALRALRWDLLASEADRAAPPKVDESKPPRFGLHPSVRFDEEGARSCVLWFDAGVRRERISPESLRLLRCFAEPGDLTEVSARLEALAMDPTYVQAEVGRWTGFGVITQV